MNQNVNVGCGMSPTPGWSNFDNSWSIRLAGRPAVVALLRAFRLLNSSQLDYIDFARTSGIRWADATSRIPLENDSVDVLYASHMLEHLDARNADSFLREALRVLRPGGILRIAVPDLKLLVDHYVRSGDADAFVTKLHMNRVMPRSLLGKFKYFLVGDRHHQWNYDGASLSRLLEKAGFSAPTVLGPGETTIPDPGNLNLREREDESLYVEARKGDR